MHQASACEMHTVACCRALWNKLLGVSKSIIDLKSAVASAKELAAGLTALGEKMKSLAAISPDMVSQVKKLSSVKDCQALLAASTAEDLGEDGSSAKDALSEAWETFLPLVPARDPAFQSFKEFMDSQWHPILA